jgi:PLAT/LH2 domain
VRELPVSDVVVDCTTVIYEVKVITGDRRGAGTDANVFIVLYGENGDSGKPKILQSASNNFERGIKSLLEISIF